MRQRPGRVAGVASRLADVNRNRVLDEIADRRRVIVEHRRG
jgi:hypothetical protein